MEAIKTCPFNPEMSTRYKISFTPLSNQSWIKRQFNNLGELISRFGISSFYCAFKITSTKDLSNIFKKAWKPGSFVSRLPTLMGTLYLTAEPQVMRAIFQNPRAESDGLFMDHENKRLFVQGIIKEIYPEELDKYGIDKVAEMLVLTAQFPGVKSLRSPLMEALGINSMKQYNSKLTKIAGDLLDSLTEEEKNNCNAELLAFEFAITVICKYMTGYNTTRENYQKLAKSVTHFSKRLNQLISHRLGSSVENDEVKYSLTHLREVIDENIHNTETTPSLQNLRNAGWDEFKIRITLLFLYFSATETTSSSMNYLLWQLGRSENKKFIDENNISKLITETLRLHPPAFIVGRQFRQDTLLEIHDDKNYLIKKFMLRKNHSIVCLIQAAAMDSSQYKDPDSFNPDRYDTIPAHLPWHPFAAGTHVCPGQYLAQAELNAFITQVLKKFDIETIYPENQIEQRGYFTLRATPAIVRLKHKG